MQQAKQRLGELLVEAEVLTEARLLEALEIQQESGSRLGTVLIQRGFVTEPQLVQALSKQLSIPWVSLWHLDISDQLLEMIPEELVLEHGVLPIYVRTLKGGDKALYVAMDNPSDGELLEKIGESCGMTVKPMIAGPSEIASAILSYYGEPWQNAPVQPPAAQRISSVPPPPRRSPEPEQILLEEVVEDEEAGPEPPPDEEAIELTEPVDEGEDEAGEEGGEEEEEGREEPEEQERLVTDLFAPREPPPAAERRRRFKPGPVNLTFLDGTSISFDSKREREEQARESRGAMEERIEELQAGDRLLGAVKGILRTLMRRGLLSEEELEDLLEDK